MKIRKGFVSNSSSSSFTCDVCGETESGMDCSLSDILMRECKNGHTFCDSHAEKLLEKLDSVEYKREFLSKNYPDNFPDINSLTDDEVEDDADNYDLDDRYGCPSEFCPICNFMEPKDSELLAYLLKSSNFSRKKVLKDIKLNFKSHDDFAKFIEGVK